MHRVFDCELQCTSNCCDVAAQEAQAISRKQSDRHGKSKLRSRTSESTRRHCRRAACAVYIPQQRTCLKGSGSQASSSSGMPRKSVTQSAVDTLPRMDTTTLLVSWSRHTMYGSAPSACGAMRCSGGRFWHAVALGRSAWWCSGEAPQCHDERVAMAMTGARSTRFKDLFGLFQASSLIVRCGHCGIRARHIPGRSVQYTALPY